MDLDKKDSNHNMAVVEADDEKVFHDEAAVVSPADNKLVRRKADLFLLPMLCVIYALQFVSLTSL